MDSEREFNLRFLQGLVDQHAHIAGDVLEIGDDTWAIHGTIPVDGDVLMAAFHQLQDARAALDQLGPDPPDESTKAR
jgi:hypothetical protein